MLLENFPLPPITFLMVHPLHGNISGLKGLSFKMSFDRIDRVLFVNVCNIC